MSNTPDGQTDRELLRRQRLVQELREEGVQLVEDVDINMSVLPDDETFGEDLRRGLSKDQVKELDDLLLDELYYARYAPVHEQRTASYGSVILLSKYDANSTEWSVVPVVQDQGQTIDDARRLADGLSTFLVRRPGHATSIAGVNGANERELVELAEETGGWIVQRHPTGAIRLYGRERVLQYMHNEWTARPYAHTRWMHLSDRLDALLGQADGALVGGAILDFCLHTLSARRVGATLAWYPKTPPAQTSSSFSKQWVPLPVELNVLAGDHLKILGTLLASVDGACVIDGETVVGAEAHLQYSEAAENAVKPTGGSRHTSAARFSHDVREAVIFVVSSDGPVSVFFGGKKIESLTNAALPPLPDDFLSVQDARALE